MTIALSETREQAADASFGRLAVQPADGLLGLIKLYRDDARASKLDLGVGVYRDATGATPVMRAVKAAEALLFAEQPTKSYLGAEGDVRFTDLLAEVVFGEALARSPRLCGVQTPGGTGALRLGAALLKRALPDAEVWIGSPTWPNHAPIFAEAGLPVRTHDFYDAASGDVAFDRMMAGLGGARRGDIVLVHGCCHNPTGATLAPEQWQALAALCENSGLIPFVDLAYQGLGDGLDADAAATRTLFERVPGALLAHSCDKNFGLYRERVGALWMQAPSAAASALAYGNMLAIARSLWSMPPDHGAAVVRLILDHPALRDDWLRELSSMRERLNALRTALAAAHPRLRPIGRQRGMFAMLPLAPDAVAQLRAANGIYMAGNGRISLAGLTAERVPDFVRAVAPWLG